MDRTLSRSLCHLWASCHVVAVTNIFIVVVYPALPCHEAPLTTRGKKNQQMPLEYHA